MCYISFYHKSTDVDLMIHREIFLCTKCSDAYAYNLQYDADFVHEFTTQGVKHAMDDTDCAVSTTSRLSVQMSCSEGVIESRGIRLSMLRQFIDFFLEELRGISCAFITDDHDDGQNGPISVHFSALTKLRDMILCQSGDLRKIVLTELKGDDYSDVQPIRLSLYIFEETRQAVRRFAESIIFSECHQYIGRRGAIPIVKKSDNGAFNVCTDYFAAQHHAQCLDVLLYRTTGRLARALHFAGSLLGITLDVYGGIWRACVSPSVMTSCRISVPQPGHQLHQLITLRLFDGSTHESSRPRQSSTETVSAHQSSTESSDLDEASLPPPSGQSNNKEELQKLHNAPRLVKDALGSLAFEWLLWYYRQWLRSSSDESIKSDINKEEEEEDTSLVGLNLHSFAAFLLSELLSDPLFRSTHDEVKGDLRLRSVLVNIIRGNSATTVDCGADNSFAIEKNSSNMQFPVVTTLVLSKFNDEQPTSFSPSTLHWYILERIIWTSDKPKTCDYKETAHSFFNSAIKDESSCTQEPHLSSLSKTSNVLEVSNTKITSLSMLLKFVHLSLFFCSYKDGSSNISHNSKGYSATEPRFQTQFYFHLSKWWRKCCYQAVKRLLIQVVTVALPKRQLTGFMSDCILPFLFLCDLGNIDRRLGQRLVCKLEASNNRPSRLVLHEASGVVKGTDLDKTWALYAAEKLFTKSLGVFVTRRVCSLYNEVEAYPSSIETFREVTSALPLVRLTIGSVVKKKTKSKMHHTGQDELSHQVSVYIASQFRREIRLRLLHRDVPTPRITTFFWKLLRLRCLFSHCGLLSATWQSATNDVAKYLRHERPDLLPSVALSLPLLESEAARESEQLGQQEPSLSFDGRNSDEGSTNGQHSATAVQNKKRRSSVLYMPGQITRNITLARRASLEVFESAIQQWHISSVGPTKDEIVDDVTSNAAGESKEHGKSTIDQWWARRREIVMTRVRGDRQQDEIQRCFGSEENPSVVEWMAFVFSSEKDLWQCFTHSFGHAFASLSHMRYLQRSCGTSLIDASLLVEASTRLFKTPIFVARSQQLLRLMKSALELRTCSDADVMLADVRSSVDLCKRMNRTKHNKNAITGKKRNTTAGLEQAPAIAACRHTETHSSSVVVLGDSEIEHTATETFNGALNRGSDVSLRCKTPHVAGRLTKKRGTIASPTVKDAKDASTDVLNVLVISRHAWTARSLCAAAIDNQQSWRETLKGEFIYNSTAMPHPLRFPSQRAVVCKSTGPVGAAVASAVLTEPTLGQVYSQGEEMADELSVTSKHNAVDSSADRDKAVFSILCALCSQEKCETVGITSTATRLPPANFYTIPNARIPRAIQDHLNEFREAYKQRHPSRHLEYCDWLTVVELRVTLLNNSEDEIKPTELTMSLSQATILYHLLQIYEEAQSNGPPPQGEDYITLRSGLCARKDLSTGHRKGSSAAAAKRPTSGKDQRKRRGQSAAAMAELLGLPYELVLSDCIAISKMGVGAVLYQDDPLNPRNTESVYPPRQTHEKYESDLYIALHNGPDSRKDEHEISSAYGEVYEGHQPEGSHRPTNTAERASLRNTKTTRSQGHCSDEVRASAAFARQRGGKRSDMDVQLVAQYENLILQVMRETGERCNRGRCGNAIAASRLQAAVRQLEYQSSGCRTTDSGQLGIALSNLTRRGLLRNVGGLYTLTPREKKRLETHL